MKVTVLFLLCVNETLTLVCFPSHRPMPGWQVAASRTLWTWRLSNGSRPWHKQVGRRWRRAKVEACFGFICFFILPFVFCFSVCCSSFFSPLPIRFCLLRNPASFPSSVFEAYNPENGERSFPIATCWCANIIAMCQVLFLLLLVFPVLYLIFWEGVFFFFFFVLRLLCVLHPRSG